MMDDLSSSDHEGLNITIDEKEEKVLSPLNEKDKSPLAKMKAEEFSVDQRSCISLSEIWKFAEHVNNVEFEVR